MAGVVMLSRHIYFGLDRPIHCERRQSRLALLIQWIGLREAVPNALIAMLAVLLRFGKPLSKTPTARAIDAFNTKDWAE